jgi:hypothetical protein
MIFGPFTRRDFRELGTLMERWQARHALAHNRHKEQFSIILSFDNAHNLTEEEKAVLDRLFPGRPESIPASIPEG